MQQADPMKWAIAFLLLVTPAAAVSVADDPTNDLQGYFEFFMRKSRAKQMAYTYLETRIV